jgi:hypothetical protein
VKPRFVLFDRFGSTVLFFLTLAIYLLSPTKDFYWDGVSFAIDIEKAAAFPTPLLHPNHLIYNHVGYWLYGAVRALSASARALFVLQTLDSLFAAAAAALVYRILRQSAAPDNNTRASEVALALLFAFSATWWKFAADADAYIASVFFLLCSYALLTAKQPRPLSIAVAHAIAMLFHQLAVFFFPAALYGLYRRRGARAAMQYAIPAFLLTIGVYGIAYRAGLRSGPPVSFLGWITAHSPGSQWSFDVPRDLGLTLLGNVRLLLGGRLAEWNSGWIEKAGATLLVIALLLSFKRVRPHWIRPATSGAATSEAPLWIWIASYSIFLFFFEPQNTFYRLFYFPAVIFLLGSRLRGAFGLAIAVVFLWNFTFLIYPRSRPESNETLAFALRESRNWPAGSGIVYSIFHPDLWTIAYFNWQASWIGLASPDIPKLETYRSDFEREGRSLWLEQTAVDLLASQPEGKHWLAAHVRDTDAVRYRSPKRSFAFYRVSAGVR